MSRPPGGVVLLPKPRVWVRRRGRGTHPHDAAERITDHLGPLARRIPPPVLDAAVRHHLTEMERLMGRLRD